MPDKPGPILTHHAEAKWKERFPGLDLHEEWAAAKRPGKKIRRIIRMRCPAHTAFTTRLFRGRYFMVSKRVIFVMAPPEIFITVFPTGHSLRSGQE